MANIKKNYDSAVFQCEFCNNHSHNNMCCGQGGVYQGDSEDNPELLEYVKDDLTIK